MLSERLLHSVSTFHGLRSNWSFKYSFQWFIINCVDSAFEVGLNPIFPTTYLSENLTTATFELAAVVVATVILDISNNTEFCVWLGTCGSVSGCRAGVCEMVGLPLRIKESGTAVATA